MRLYEVAGNKFQDDLATVLKSMQGRANDRKTTSIVTWPAVNNLMLSFGYGNVSKDMVDKIKTQIDPSGQLIQDVADQGIILKTDVQSPESPKNASYTPNTKSVDQMARSAAKKELQ